MMQTKHHFVRLDENHEAMELLRAIGLLLIALAAGVCLFNPIILAAVYLTKGWKGWRRAVEVFFIAELAAAYFIGSSYYRRRRAHYNTS